MTRLKYCHIQGKVRYPTYYAAARVLAVMLNKQHHTGGSVYRCIHCHDFHITHFVDTFDYKVVQQSRSKKLLRSRRRKERIKYKPPKYDLFMPILTKEEFAKVFESREFMPYRHKLNLCILLADVIDSWLMDIVPYMQHRTGYFRQLDKKMFKRAIEDLRRAKSTVNNLSSYMYDKRENNTEQACVDSDWFKDLLWHINDRIDETNSDETQVLILSMIKNSFKSKFNLT